MPAITYYQIKASEGETLENKIANDKELINENLQDENIYFDYVSALKKLYSQDSGIKKLTGSDCKFVNDIGQSC